jgi:hypothetical protein
MDHSSYYFNQLTGEISLEETELISDAQGGIICEDMVYKQRSTL